MKKRLLAVLMVAAMVLALTACGESSSSSSTAAASTAKSEAAATETADAGDYPTADNPITIKMANFVTEEDSLGQIYTFAAEKLEELSGGAIKCELYFNGTVLGFGDMFTGVAEGTADIGLVGMAIMDSNTDLNQIFSALRKGGMPDDDEVINECYWKACEAIPAIDEELASKGIVRVGFQAFAGADTVLGSTSPITTADALKGQIIQSSQSQPGKLFTALGGSAVSMEVSDYYNSLDRGVTNGVYDTWSSFDAQKLAELCTDYTQFGNGGLSAGAMSVVMNLNTFNKLSAEQQQMVYDAFEYGIHEALAAYDAQIDNAKALAAEKNANIVTLEGDDLEPFYSAIDEINEEWFTTLENAGYADIREYYDTIGQILADAM